MANGKSKVVTAAPSTGVAVLNNDENRPARLKDYQGGSGLGIGANDLIIPRMKLLQGTSPELLTFEKAKQGMFWMNVLDLPFGDKLDFIVCSYRTRILLLQPLPAKGILARADDGIHWVPPNGEWQVVLKGVKKPVTWRTKNTVRESGLMEFGSSNPDDPDSNPAATMFYEYLVYLCDYPDKSPVVLSLARSQAKKAKDLNGKLEFRRAPAWDQKFRAAIVQEGDEGERYFNFAFASNGWASDTESAFCKGIGERFKDYRGADEEGAATETAKASAPAERGDL